MVAYKAKVVWRVKVHHLPPFFSLPRTSLEHLPQLPDDLGHDIGRAGRETVQRAAERAPGDVGLCRHRSSVAPKGTRGTRGTRGTVALVQGRLISWHGVDLLTGKTSSRSNL